MSTFGLSFVGRFCPLSECPLSEVSPYFTSSLKLKTIIVMWREGGGALTNERGYSL